MASTVLLDAAARALGSPVVHAARVGGGSIHEALRLELGDGRRAFLKCGVREAAVAFEAEADGLRWLAAAGAVAVPEVLALLCTDAASGLLLPWIEPGRGGPRGAVRLGRELAALHAAGAAAYGYPRDNFVGSLPQPNSPRSSWAEFHGEARLLPAAARVRGAAAELLPAVERVVRRLPELLGPAEPPARLHGDLWGGNALFDREGRPWLVDPAVYGGHREVDLAMMQLFGGFDAATFDAYDEALPRAPGHRERLPLYQLYPLLVHAALFGGGYVGQALAIARRFG